MRFSISTWSLHGLLTSGTSLLDLPPQIAQRGFECAEICHFHLLKTDPAYLELVRQAFASANVEIYSVLIDAGDITAPDLAQREADLEFIKGWIQVASQLGATGVRIDAGLQPPTPEVVALSAAALKKLSTWAAERGVKVFTENWHETSRQPAPLLEILSLCPGVGLCVDSGNAEGPDKYQTLEQLMPRGTSMHFKARYLPSGEVDLTDAARVFEMAQTAGFNGPVSLIYGETENEWEHVEKLKTALEPFISV